MNTRNNNYHPEIINICNDAVFKAIFTKNTDDSRTALKSLLSAFLEKKLSIIDVTANDAPINDLRDRQIRFDISVRFNDGELANVEMTVNPRYYEALRFEYYTARLFLNQNIRGQDRTYRDLKPAYHLSFLCGNLYDDNDWLHRFIYYDPERKIRMGGLTEIMTVELNKLRGITGKTVKQIDSREGWALFMMYDRVDKKTGIIQHIITMDEGIAAADRVIRGFTETELEGLAAISRDKFDFDAREELADMKRNARAEGLAEGLAEGRIEGHAEGRTEGRTEAINETARKLKALGIPLAQIAEATGILPEQIESL